MNSLIHFSTGTSPSQLLFGGAVDPNRHLFRSAEPLPTEKGDLKSWVADIREAQTKMYKEAEEHRDKMQKAYIGPEPTQLEPGDLVLVTTKGDKRTTKLDPNILGPQAVVKQHHNWVTCRHSATGKEEGFDISRLRMYNIDPNFDEAEIAAYDLHGAHIVNKVLGHKLVPNADPKNKKSWMFHLQWENLTKEWCGYQAVRTCGAVIDYVFNLAVTKGRDFECCAALMDDYESSLTPEQREKYYEIYPPTNGEDLPEPAQQKPRSTQARRGKVGMSKKGK